MQEAKRLADKDKDRTQLNSILTALITMVGGAAAAPLAQAGAAPQPRPMQAAWNPQAAMQPQPQPQPQRPAVYPQGIVQPQLSRPAPLSQATPQPRPFYPAMTSQAALQPQPQRPAVYPREIVQPQTSRPMLGPQLATQAPFSVTTAPAAPSLPVSSTQGAQAQAQPSAGNSALLKDIMAAPEEPSVCVLPSPAASVLSESTAGAQPALQSATGTRRGISRERKPPAALRDYAAD